MLWAPKINKHKTKIFYPSSQSQLNAYALHTNALSKSLWISLSLWLQCLIALLLGLYLIFSFPPYHQNYLAFIIPAILLTMLLFSSPYQAASYALCFYLGFLGGSVSWVYISLQQFGQLSPWIACLITFLFILLLASLFSLSMALFRYTLCYLPWKISQLTFPMAWILSEWLQSHFLTGFPWIFIGHSQIATAIKNYAPILGGVGVSWITILAASQGTYFFLSKSRFARTRSFSFIVGLYLIGFLLHPIDWNRISTNHHSSPIKIMLLQGNINPVLKWNPKNLDKILSIYQNLLLNHWKQKSLVVMPESAIPSLPSQIKPFILKMNQQAIMHQSGILIGMPLKGISPKDQKAKIYNGLISLGFARGYYQKRHLVPFGEYLPFRKVLSPLINHFLKIPMSHFSPGKNKQPLIYFKSTPIAVFICYEIAYAELVRSAFPKAEFIAVISDDAWFGHSQASLQHQLIARMRALETARYLLMSNNTGITSIINPKGKVINQIPPNKVMALQGTIYPETAITPFVYFGQNLLFFLLLLSFGLGLLTC